MQATLDAFSLKGPSYWAYNPPAHIRTVFTKALTCLSKYGDELAIYATPQNLTFSATNSSKSAYSRFKYENKFFSRYRLGDNNAHQRDFGDDVEDVQNVTGQLLTKVLFDPFLARFLENKRVISVPSIHSET
jgi:hypothetical protein